MGLIISGVCQIYLGSMLRGILSKCVLSDVAAWVLMSCQLEMQSIWQRVFPDGCRCFGFIFLVLVVVSTQVGDYARVMSLLLLVKSFKTESLAEFSQTFMWFILWGLIQTNQLWLHIWLMIVSRYVPCCRLKKNPLIWQWLKKGNEQM